jgi:hypothetical protein
MVAALGRPCALGVAPWVPHTLQYLHFASLDRVFQQDIARLHTAGQS